MTNLPQCAGTPVQSGSPADVTHPGGDSTASARLAAGTVIEPTICAGCPTELPPTKANALTGVPGRQRKWCSDKCRKNTTYVRFCADCGKRLSSSDGDGPNAPRRCNPCANTAIGAAAKIWTRDAIILAIQEWAAKYGDHPAVADWNPHQARHYYHDETRAARYEREHAAGTCPSFITVIDEFGSWNAAIEAAGLEPRAPHGGGGNGARHRSVRARSVAV